VTATFSNGDRVPVVHIGSGIGQGTWGPSSAGTIGLQCWRLRGQNGALTPGQSATLTTSVSSSTTPICLDCSPPHDPDAGRRLIATIQIAYRERHIAVALTGQAALHSCDLVMASGAACRSIVQNPCRSQYARAVSVSK